MWEFGWDEVESCGNILWSGIYSFQFKPPHSIGWPPTCYLLSRPPIQTPLISDFVWSPLQHPFSNSLSSCPMFRFDFPSTFCYWLLNRLSHPCEDLDEMKQSQVELSLSSFNNWMSWGFLLSCMNLGLELVIISTYPDTIDCNMCTKSLAKPIFQVLYFSCPMFQVPISSHFATSCVIDCHPCENLDEMKQGQVELSLWNVVSSFQSNLLPVSTKWMSWGYYWAPWIWGWQECLCPPIFAL